MSSNKIRVFIVDDHPMIRTGLAAAVGAEDDLVLAGDATNGGDAVRLIPAAVPDVVLMDLYMPDMDGIATIVRLGQLMPNTRFVILTSAADPREVERAIDAGACGYLLKTASSDEIVSVIRATHKGRRVLAPEATDALIASRQQRASGIDLTQREKELLVLMTRGLNNLEIAAELSIAMATVKFHITNILGKLEVENRTEAVLKAIKHKLVPPL